MMATRRATGRSSCGHRRRQDWARLSYRYRPAPWTLYGGIPAVLFALFGVVASWRELRSIGPARPGIEDIGATDRPIGWNDPDVLGLQPLAPRAVAVPA